MTTARWPSGVGRALAWVTIGLVFASGGPLLAQQGQDKKPIGGKTPTPTAVAGVSVTLGPSGPVVSWLAVNTPAKYSVRRWKEDEPQCCVNTSPELAGPPWQDSPPPKSGPYVYRVTVTTSAGTASGDARFQYTAPPTAVTGIAITNTGSGLRVTWQAIAGATYSVSRRKDGDIRCCNAVSPTGLTVTSWQDVPLTYSGTYIYRVLATFGGTTVSGEASYVWQQPVTATATPVTSPTVTTSTLTTTTTTTAVAPALATATGSAITLTPGAFTSRPASVSWASDRIDLFIRGKDNALWHRWWNGTTWSGWESLGGVLVSAPSVYSWGPGHLDVYVTGTDNAVWRRAYADGRWLDWESLGGSVREEPAVASWGPGRVDLFARGTDDALYHKWFEGGRWSAWEGLGGTIYHWGPTASSWGSGRLDVFVRGGSSAFHRWYEGGWSGWEQIESPGTYFTFFPLSAASFAVGRVDVFSLHGQGIVQWTYDRGQVAPWSSKGAAEGLPASALYPLTQLFPQAGPRVSVRGGYLLDLFLVGADGRLYHRTFTVDRWGPWNSMGLP